MTAKASRKDSRRRGEGDGELDRLAESYAAASVHGVLPLALDRDSGTLRFARLGEERPEDCLTDASLLPEAQADLLVFRDPSSLAYWKAGILETAGNSVAVEVPGTKWPKAALLVRHDCPARGGTLEQAVALRLPLGGGLDPAAAAALGREMRRDWLRVWLHERGQRDFEAEWAAEISALQAIPQVVVEGRRTGQGGLSFTVSEEGGFMGLGPSFRLERVAGGYRAYWRLGELRIDEAASARICEAAEALGAGRDGYEMSLDVASLSRGDVLRLAEAFETVSAAARGVPEPGRSRPGP